MQVRDKVTGAVETLRYDVAVATVDAGTHDMVSLDAEGRPKEDRKLKPKTKLPEA